MKRAPIVIVGTVAGLVGVLEFHTTPAKLAIASESARRPPLRAVLAPQAVQVPGHHRPQCRAGASRRARRPGLSSAGKRAASGTAVGPGVNYSFGVVAVRVTVSRGKIVKIGIASLQDQGDPRSQVIDQQALPILEHEALVAQSASIQGVSGASYTSAGFIRSLQSALQSLGM